MTNDAPPTPFLAMGRKELACRLAAKELLRRAFSTFEGVEHDPGGDTHGEFGPKEEWAQRRGGVLEWIQKNPTHIESIVKAICAGNKQMAAEDLIEYLRIELLPRIDECVCNPSITANRLSECLAEGAVLPMFGMPTRVRNLYHGAPVHEGDSTPRSIDRDLDIAIVDFAPRAQKTKDKRVHTSIGFTPALTYRRGKFHEISASSTFCFEKKMQICHVCHYVGVSSEEPVPESCPRCGANVPAYSEIDARTPTAFRTDFSDGQDALEDAEIVRAPAARLANSLDPTDFHVEHNARLGFTSGGRVYTLNDNNGRLYNGATRQRENASNRESNLSAQWIDEKYLPDNSPNLEEIVLVAPKTTDLLSISPALIPEGLNLDVLTPGSSVKAAYASAAFVIRATATDMLDIDPEELDVCHLRSVQLEGNENGDSAFVGEIVISDYHPNGSGFTRWLRDNWLRCLNAVCKPTGGDSFADMLLSPSHAEACQDACYRCLKNFRNMSYHALLDWRLGVSVLKVLAGGNYRAGLDGDFNSPELMGWPQHSRKQRDRLVAAFSKEGVIGRDWGKLSGFDAGQFRVVIVHELWDTNSVPTGSILSEAIGIAKNDIGTKTLCFATPFNLVRRPSWTLHELAQHGRA